MKRLIYMYFNASIFLPKILDKDILDRQLISHLSFKNVIVHLIYVPIVKKLHLITHLVKTWKFFGSLIRNSDRFFKTGKNKCRATLARSAFYYFL